MAGSCESVLSICSSTKSWSNLASTVEAINQLMHQCEYSIGLVLAARPLALGFASCYMTFSNFPEPIEYSWLCIN